MIIWSSLGWKKEVKNEEEAAEIAKTEVEKYTNQKITLSWIDDDQQEDKIIFDGTDESKKNGWLNMIKQARELEGE